MPKPIDRILFFFALCGFLWQFAPYLGLTPKSHLVYVEIEPQWVIDFLAAFTILSGIYLIATIKFKIDRPTKSEARKILHISDQVYKLTLMGLRATVEIIDTDEIDRIVTHHSQRIQDKIEEHIDHVRDNTHQVINMDFLEAASDKSRKSEFEAMANKKYKELINPVELERYIKKEYHDAQLEILTFMTKKLREEDVWNYIYHLKNEIQGSVLELNDQRRGPIFFWYNPKLKDVYTVGYERKIISSCLGIPDMDMPYYKQPDVDMPNVIADAITVASLVTLINVEDYAIDGIHTILHEAVGEQTAWAIAENIGMAIPVVSYAFLILKAVRYVRLFMKIFGNDRDKELNEIRTKIANDIVFGLEKFGYTASVNLETTSYQLVANFRKRLEKLRQDAIDQRYIAEKYGRNIFKRFNPFSLSLFRN